MRIGPDGAACAFAKPVTGFQSRIKMVTKRYGQDERTGYLPAGATGSANRCRAGRSSGLWVMRRRGRTASLTSCRRGWSRCAAKATVPREY